MEVKNLLKGLKLGSDSQDSNSGSLVQNLKSKDSVKIHAKFQ